MSDPYSQGGWTSTTTLNAGSSRSIPPQRSIYGALPFPTQRSAFSASMFTSSFRFASLSPTACILNSTVSSTHSHHTDAAYFRITTDVPTVGFTAVHNSANEPMVIIEWAKQPVVEIRDILSKRRAAQWLALSEDKSYRTMSFGGKTFVWAPYGESICLYAAGLGAPQIYAREAIRLGLLEVTVTAAILLQCGRRID
ncbi:hypothetical protein B0H14DRAFT_3472946 [Mycena olivaceomarginata]|nr:hypothetical protein B0H14DRAFT_3472946 [Mycena olivaceomarginata]